MRGEVYRLKRSRSAVGREQQGVRCAVVVQSSDLEVLSTWLVAPTSTSATPTSFRPRVEILDAPTLVLCEQTTAVDPSRLGDRIELLSQADIEQVDDALRLVLDLS